MAKCNRSTKACYFSIVALGAILVSTPSGATCNPLKPIDAYNTCGKTVTDTVDATLNARDAALKATMDVVTRAAAKEKARMDAIEAAAAAKEHRDGMNEDLGRFLIREEVKTDLKAREYEEKWGTPAPSPAPSPSPVPLPPGASLDDPHGVKLDVAARGRISDLSGLKSKVLALPRRN